MTDKQTQTIGDFVEQTLKANGYFVEKNVSMGDGPYDTAIHADFVAHNSKRFKDGIAIKTYWQTVGGSADEKFPYMALTIKEHYPIPAVIVYAGDGYRECAIDWLQEQADGKKLVAVLHAQEFDGWMRRNKR